MRLSGLVEVACFLTVLASFLGSLENLWWPLYLAVHFRLQYAIVLSLGTALLALWRRRVSALLCGAFAAWNLALVAPAWIAQTPAERTLGQDSDQKLRILHSNILTRNVARPAVLRLIEETRADVVVLQEVSLEWWRALESLRETYPHSLCEPRSDNFGIALLSKRPMQSCEVRYFGPSKPPSIVAVFETEAGPLHLIAAHPLPPQRRDMIASGDGQLQRIGEFCATLTGHVIVVGDLNTTPWANNFHALLDASNLRDSRRGFGNQATWPTNLWPMMIPLDHVLVSPDINVLDRTLGPLVGSDHLPVIVDLRLQRAAK